MAEGDVVGVNIPPEDAMAYFRRKRLAAGFDYTT
jgi:hypothetical protein